MDLKAKLDKGIELKNAGNNAFTSNDIKAGTDNIQEAMGSHTLNKDPVKQEIKQMIATCYSNMAACLIKEEKWPKVIDYCQKALALDSQNKKAKFRLGQAYLRTGKIELAKEKLQELATSDPEDAAVKRELVLLKEKDKIASVKEKRIYKNMFERMSKEPEN